MRQQTIKTGYEPRKHQKEIHQGLKRFSVLVCHRRFGKTVLSINALIDAALRCTLERPRYGYIAPLYSQAKSVAWDYLKHFTASIPGVKRNESELWVELPGDRRIRLFGADNPDALRGLYFDGVVLDEVAQMKPEVWGEIIRPAISDRKGWVLFIGTPKGMNLFSELYYSALKDDAWYAGFYPVSKTGVVAEDELLRARATMSENQYRQEFECDFSASGEDILISIDLITAAACRVYHQADYMYAPKVMGVDVARFGDDKSVILYRQGLASFGLKKFKDTDLMQLSSIIANEIDRERPDAVFIDAIGIGAGVVDRLRQLRYKVIGVVSGETASRNDLYINKRIEMWADMRDWLKDGGAIPDDLELKGDLSNPTYTYDNQGRIKLEKKEDMKKRGLGSPDVGDALALTFAMPVKKDTPVEVAARMIPKPKYNPLRW
ncbi:MAG: terminase [Candidatus Omnitrophota bacterium]